MKTAALLGERGRTMFRMVTLAVLGLTAAAWATMIPARAAQASASDAAVRGVVQDAAGKPVAGATVRLEYESDVRAMETTSGADGSFVFATAEEGRLKLSARKGAMQIGDVETTRSKDGHVVILTLGGSGLAPGTQQMEFSDSPNFAIAAVTDWTAAGGHGSDAILRTSESLNRDAVQLGEATRVSSADPAMKQAIALEEAGDYARARQIARDHLERAPAAAWLRLAGELDEKLGDPVAAVNEFQRAVHEDGSEENYFAWGSELLRHRAVWQAKDVFTAGAQRYPKSERMLTALGAALFACSLYDDAAQKLCEAADLNGDSDEPYLFLGKAELASPNPLPRCSEEKLADFVKHKPSNALANYYDAMAIWKQNGRSANPQILARVEGFLNHAVELDPKCGDAYLQLGNIDMSRHETSAAIEKYRKAVETNPELAEAHYRLGVAYDRAGDKVNAEKEFAIHERLDKRQAAEVERERREVKQFLVQGSGDAAKP